MFIIRGKQQTRQGGTRTVYYKHYDGSRPIMTSKGGAARMEREMGERVLRQLRQLRQLGVKDLTLHDEQDL